MSIKAKLTSVIVSFVLVLGLLITGVFALSNPSVNMGGTVSFEEKDVYAKVSGKIENTEGQDKDLNPITFDYSSTQQTSYEGWTNNALKFKDKTTEIKLTITIENLSTERSLYYEVQDTTGAITNVTKKIDGNELSTTGIIELDAKPADGQSKVDVVLTMKITDPSMCGTQKLN